MGSKFRSAVGGDMEGDAMLCEYVGNEGISNVHGSSSISSGNEHAFLGKAIDDDGNGGESMGGRKLFDEVHTDGVPGSLRYRERLKKPVRAMARGLVVRAEDA